MTGQLSELLHTHFEEHQLDEGTLSYSAAARAAAIKKKISVIALNSGISDISLEQNASTPCIDDTIQLILLQYVDKLMAVNVTSGNREAVERLMDLVAAFVVTSSKELGEAIVGRTIQFSSVLLERVRGQASIMMGYLAMHFSKKADEWSKEWFEALNDALLPRLTDKSQAVRNSAIRASALFLHEQCDGMGIEDLLDAILWNLWHDPSVANRVAALESLPVIDGTVDHIVTRIRDVKEKVRVQALEVLRNKLDPLSHMTADHFAEVIRSGLSDRCGSSKEATSRLICSKWMKAAKFDPIKLLKRMDIIVNEEECEIAMKVVLEVARSRDCALLNDLSDPEIRAFQAGISIEKSVTQAIESGATLDAEQLFFARIACVTAQESTELSPEEKYDLLNNAIPDIPLLCERFHQYSIRLSEAIQEGDSKREDECCFLCLQLLHLAEVVGLNDEGSRRHFSSFMKTILSSESTPDDLVEGCVEALRVAKEHETDFLKAISEIINHLSHETTPDEVTQTDSSYTLRILSILAIVLENASSDAASHDLFQNASAIVISAVTHPNVLVREAGVSCLGTLGFFTKQDTVTADFKPIILEVASNDKEKLEIRSQALLALSDWTLLFSEILNPCEIGDKKTSFLAILETMMQHKNPSVVAIAAEISIKLLFSGKVCESSLVARLLVLFFDPRPQSGSHVDLDDAKEVGNMVRLQQLLSLFFTAFCIKSEYGRSAMLGSLEFALGLAVTKEPGKSSKKKITFPLLKMIEFVCATVESGREADSPSLDIGMREGASIALSVSVQIANFLISEDSLSVTQSRALYKFLGNLEISLEGDEKTTLCELRDLLEELGMIASDELSLCSLSMLSQKIAEIDLSDIDNLNKSCNEDEDVSCDDTVSDSELEPVCVDDNTTGESTIEDSLMNSMNMLAVADKENARESLSSKSVRGRKGAKKQSRTSDVSVLESLGSIASESNR